MEDKKIVSPFEFAITQIADPEKAKTMRPETEKEKELRLVKKFSDLAKRIKTK